jgi:hypothetical protein
MSKAVTLFLYIHVALAELVTPKNMAERKRKIIFSECYNLLKNASSCPETKGPIPSPPPLLPAAKNWEPVVTFCEDDILPFLSIVSLCSLCGAHFLK